VQVVLARSSKIFRFTGSQAPPSHGKQRRTGLRPTHTTRLR